MVLQGMYSPKHNLLFNSGRFITSLWIVAYLTLRFLYRLWKDAAVCTQILEGHSDAITSTRFINKGQHAWNNNFSSLCYKRHPFKNYFCFIVAFSYYFISDWHESCYCRSWNWGQSACSDWLKGYVIAAIQGEESTFFFISRNLAWPIIIFFLYLSLCLGLLKCDTSVSMDYPKRVGAYKILRGHTSSVQSIAVDPSSDMVIITYSGLSHQCLLLFLLTVTTFPSDLLFRYLALFWFLG